MPTPHRADEVPAPAPDTRQMGVPERLAFAAGDIFLGGGGAVAGILGFFFLTDIIGLRPALAGVASAIGPLVDMVYRPAMAQVCDNVRTRWGRRRPFIVAGALLVPATAATAWAPIGAWPEQWAKFAFCTGSALFGTAVGSIVGLNYDALSTECSTNPGERNSANLIRLAFSTISGAAGTLLAASLASQYKAGRLSFGALYWTLVAGFGGVYLVSLLLVGLVVRERAPVARDRAPFRLRAYTEPFRVPAFRVLVALYLCQALAMDAIKRLLLALTAHVTHMDSTLFLGIVVVVSLLGFFVVNRLVRRVSKNRIYGALLPLAIAGAAAIALWPSSWPAWPAYGFALAFAIGFCGAQMMPWVMFPDVVDAAELALGRRNSATLSAVMLFCRGLASSTMGMTIGFALDAAGYRSATGSTTLDQPPAAILTIRLILVVSVVLLLGLAWWLARRYPLTTAAVADIGERLTAARAERALAPAEAAGP